jgi:uncharacterized protein DUF4384
MQIPLSRAAFCLTVAAAAICPIEIAQAQESDRGVTILDSVPTPPPPLPNLTPAPPPTPSASPTPADPSAPGGADLPSDAQGPGTDAPKAAAVSPQPPIPAIEDAGKLRSHDIAPTADQAELSQAIRNLPNPAGLSLDLVPSTDVQVGTRMSVHVLSRKMGYLILIDVDPTGRLTQIFPNPRSLLASKSSPRRANLIEPGKAITIPDSKNPFSGFELRATPPTGRALLLGLLSNRPVQVLDLPDIPSSIVGQADALTYLQEMAQRLKVAQLNGALEQIDWSFAAQFYSIR